jgi:hypothetical protein
MSHAKRIEIDLQSVLLINTHLDVAASDMAKQPHGKRRLLRRKTCSQRHHQSENCVLKLCSGTAPKEWLAMTLAQHGFGHGYTDFGRVNPPLRYGKAVKIAFSCLGTSRATDRVSFMREMRLNCGFTPHDITRAATASQRTLLLMT